MHLWGLSLTKPEQPSYAAKGGADAHPMQDILEAEGE